MDLTRRLVAGMAVLALALPAADAAAHGRWHGDDSGRVKARTVASGLAGTIGGTIGPDGALYVPQFALGEITRIDLRTGRSRTFARGFPTPPLPDVVPIGGAFDIEFVDGKAYVLVSLLLGTSPSGLYRVDRRGNAHLVADLGLFSAMNPPDGGCLSPGGLPECEWLYDLPEGVQYAMRPFREGFLVTDGHHNRVLYVTLGGDVSTVVQYGNVVPAGLAVTADRVYLAQTGEITGDPAQEIGQVVSFDPDDPAATREVAGNISMPVDVAFGPGGVLYALSQGDFGGGPAGAPAAPGTGRLLRLEDDGSATVLLDGLNLPTSLYFDCDDAYIVTLAGEVLKVTGLDGRKGDGCRHCRDDDDDD